MYNISQDITRIFNRLDALFVKLSNVKDNAKSPMAKRKYYIQFSFRLQELWFL